MFLLGKMVMFVLQTVTFSQAKLAAQAKLAVQAQWVAAIWG